MSLYTNYSPLYVHLEVTISPISDVGALGVIDRGGCWRVATSLFGVVETIVVLVGARRGLCGATGKNAPAQQGEDSAHPSSVEGEAKRHEVELLVSADGKPHRRHRATQCCGQTDRQTVKIVLLKATCMYTHIESGNANAAKHNKSNL